MWRIFDTCAVILLAVCLPILLKSKENTTDTIAAWTDREEKAGSRLAQDPLVLRDCDNGESSTTAIVEYTFPEGFLPTEDLCPNLLQQLKQVS